MAIDALNIETKTNNPEAPGVSGTAHKLTAGEFNSLVYKVNELITQANKTVYITEEQYQILLNAGKVENDVEYNIIEE